MGGIVAIIGGIISAEPAAMALWDQLSPLIEGGAVAAAPAAAQTPLLNTVQALVTDTPEALALWNAVSPVLVSGQEPTAAEWATLNGLADAAHAAVQNPGT